MKLPEIIEKLEVIHDKLIDRKQTDLSRELETLITELEKME